LELLELLVVFVNGVVCGLGVVDGLFFLGLGVEMVELFLVFEELLGRDFWFWLDVDHVI
jgi:hypothetical protein